MNRPRNPLLRLLGTTIRTHPISLALTLLVSGLAAGVVLASQQVASEVSLTRWDHGLSSAPGEQSSAPTTSARTCPGPELMGVKGAPDAAQQVHVLAARAPGSVFPDDPGEGGQLTLTAGGSTSQVEGLSANADVSTPTPVMVQATDGHAPGLAASQWWSSEIKDLRGLVTTVSSWLREQREASQWRPWLKRRFNT